MRSANPSRLNIVTLGRSGVGKSSLLNYLLGRQHFKTGVGRPVTGAGFFETESEIAGVKVTIIDSYGIESGANFEKWKQLLEKKLKTHDTSHPIEEWLHVVIYCISAYDKRIEPIDTQIISRLGASDQKIIIAITNADQGEDVCRELRNEVCRSCPNTKEENFVEIDSVNYKKQYSGVELRKMIMEHYFDNVFKALPEHCIRLAKIEIEKFFARESSRLKQWVEYKRFDAEHNSQYIKLLKDDCSWFVDSFKKELFPKIIKDAVTQSMAIAQNLGLLISQGISDGELCKDFSVTFDDILNKPSSFWSDSWVDNIGLALVAVSTVWFVAPYVIIDELFNGEEKFMKSLETKLGNFCENMKSEIDKRGKDIDKLFLSLKDNILSGTNIQQGEGNELHNH